MFSGERLEYPDIEDRLELHNVWNLKRWTSEGWRRQRDEAEETRGEPNSTLRRI